MRLSRSIRSFLLLLLLLAGTGRLAAAQGDGAFSFQLGQKNPAATATKPAAREHARAELLADTQAIEPGRPFRLGVRFAMDPGWHIYWRNSGDAGLPTQIVWRLPPGFKAGELQWPAPSRHDEAGLTTYGYEGTVLLFAEVTPPATLPEGQAPLDFAAQVNWLVCKEQCLPGQAALKLTLPAGKAAPSAAAEDFDRFAALVPVSLAAESALVRVKLDPPAVSPAKEAALKVEATPQGPWRLDASAAGNPALEPELFPVLPESWEATHARLLAPATPEGARFELPLKLRSPAQEAKNLAATAGLQAVLRLPLVNSQTQARRTVRVLVDVPLEAASATQAGALEAASATQAGALPASSVQPSAQSPASPSNNQGLSFLSPDQAKQSFFLALLYAFIGGLILNVMPCVLPVLSLKVLGFVRQAGEDRARSRRLSLVYGLGVLASFGVLAAAVIVLKAAGAQVGQGFQFQEPRFVILMAALLLALGLSLLGVYSLELPGSAVAGMDALARREGYGGAFFNGVLSTALATPCTAPFLGGALGFALAQPAGVVLLFFLVTGLGLATPYVLLTANPSWLRWIPRPGPWMETFKQLMGFVLLGFAIWLLSVLPAQVGADGVIWTLAFLLAVALGCWLVGRGVQGGGGRRRHQLYRIVAIAVIVVSFLAFPERYLRSFTRVGQAAAVAPKGTLDTQTGAWEPFSVKRVEELVGQGRTVFVDFTADWCFTCKTMEPVLNSERVRQAFARHQVVTMRADWTAYDPVIGRVLAQLGSSGVPFYVIFPAGRAGEPIKLPTLITPGLIEQALDEAARGGNTKT